MNYIDRIQSRELNLPDDLWQAVDHISEGNIEDLISSLEISVSNGWLGVAAEISDLLEATNLLDTNPSWKIRTEIERVKRVYSLGFERTTIVLSNRILDFIQTSGAQLSKDDCLLWRSTAIGHLGWLVDSKKLLQDIAEESKTIIDGLSTSSLLKAERTSFLYALKGRLSLFNGNIKGIRSHFDKAVGICEKKQFFRSLAHIKTIYAEHLALSCDWESATRLARNLLFDASQMQIKTHLLFRAIILLLEAPREFVDEKEIRKIAFRYHILIYAMGLTQSQTLYPLLIRAKRVIPTINIIDIDKLDWRLELRRWISQLNWESVEKLLAAYYQSLGFVVSKLADDFPAFDLLATYRFPEGTQHVIAIQVKAWHVNRVNKENIPDIESFEIAKRKLQEYQISHISSVHWYILSGIHERAHSLLKKHVEMCFGSGCTIEITTGVDKLIDFLLDEPEVLKRIIFDDEWK